MTMPLTLVVTIDTEGDAWEPTRGPEPTLNIGQVPALEAVFRTSGVRATYLITWQVATDPWTSALMRDVNASGEAEIGAHLHPWNNPPTTEPFESRNTMLCNLPGALQREKLARLTEAVTAVRAGAPPVSFRAGRWGFGRETAEALRSLGYRIDTSVTPFTSWAEYHGPSFDGAPTAMYRLGTRYEVTRPDPEGALVEVPLTVGFNRRPFDAWGKVARALQRGPLKRLRAPGIAWRTGLLRRWTLSPETTTAPDMLALCRSAMAEGSPWVNLMFHSQSLTPGLTPFVRTRGDHDRFMGRLRDLVEGLPSFAAVTFATLSEAVAAHGPRVGLSA